MEIFTLLGGATRRGVLMSIAVLMPAMTQATPLTGSKHPPKPPANALLNVNFGSNAAWAGSAATGNGPSDQWNPYWAPYLVEGQVSDLYWSDGQLSPASLTVRNAPGAWTTGHPDGMMNTFIHSFGYQPIDVTLANLPNGTYDIYVYAHGVLDEQNAAVTAENSGLVYGPESTTTTPDWLSGVWTEGWQYVLLHDVSVIGGTPLVIHAGPGATELGILNGIQLRQTSDHVKHVKGIHVPKPPANPILNVDFANASAWSGPAAVGHSSSDVWNSWYAPYQYYSQIFFLRWSTGAPSGVSASIENAPGAWENGHADGMMNTFTHSFGYQTINVVFNDLPNGTYDLYVYAHGVQDQNSLISVEADGETYGPESTTTGTDWLSSTWREGSQYVQIKNVHVVGGTPLILHSAPGATELGVLNGIQFVQTSTHAKKIKAPKDPNVPKDALLNVDFANPGVWNGVAATGDGVPDVWNSWYAPYQYFSEIFDLRWSTGANSGASAVIENAPGAWDSGLADLMMSTFAHSFSYQPILVTFSDLPSGRYDVYVYSHGVLNEQNSSIRIETGGVTYGPETTTSGPDWTATAWAEGSQYVLLPNVVINAGDTLLLRSDAAAADLAVLNGVQFRRVGNR